MPIPWTTTPLQVAPAAASGVSVAPSGTSWVSGSYVEVEASTSAAWLLAGISVAPSASSHTAGVDFEVDVAVGGAGSESVIATFHGVIFGTTVPRGVLLCPILIDAIPSSSRVSVRVRESSTQTGAYGISVHYYAKPLAGSAPSTANPLKTTASGSGSSTSLSAGASAWTDGSYAEIVASTSTDIAIVGAVQFATTNGISYEIDLATGGSGSETVVATLRDQDGGITDGEPFVTWFPAPLSVASGTRLASRLRASVGAISGGLCLLYFERPLGAGVASSLLTTSRLKTTPAADAAISLAPGASSGVYGSWTEVVASAASDLVVAGLVPGTMATCDVELGVGGAGSESGIGVWKFAGGETGAQTNMVLLPVAVGGRVPSGSRISARVRSDAGASTTVTLSYYDSLNSDNVTTSGVPACLPDDGSRAVLTPNTSGAWANSAYVELTTGLPRTSAIYGVVLEQGISSEIEIDVAIGGSGSETVVATAHAYKSTNVGHGVAIFPAVVPVTAGVRIAIRGRRDSTSSASFKAGLLYYDNLILDGIIGAIALGYKGTTTASRSLIVSLDGNANTLSEVGKMKVFGDFEVTGTSTIPGIGGISQLTGDVTAGPGSGSQAATIPNNTVTYAKMQNVSAASKLLGRGSAGGAGDPEEITVGTGLTMTGTTLTASASAPALDDLTDVTITSVADGEVLTYDSGTSAWVNAAPSGGVGSVVLLEQHTASSSATIDLTAWYSSSYDHYRIDLINVVPATNAATLRLECSTDGGSTWDTTSAYGHSSQYSNWSGANGVVNSAGETSAFVGGTLSNSAGGGGLNGELHLYQPGSSTAQKSFIIDLTFWSDDGNYYRMQTGGWYVSTTAVDGIRFLMSSGNIATGIFRIYGIKNS